ncbi:MAG TPA: hypothetical protein VMZ52_03600 [Bryobacteraceae bacterium]|nr:hypothetical protein [Bryobacteraceae bacterium]
MALDPKVEQLIKLLLTGTTGVPITLTQGSLDPVLPGKQLARQEPIPVFFPECSDVLLSLCRPSNPIDEIDTHFSDYFSFQPPVIIESAPAPQDRTAIDPQLAKCAGNQWPPHCCLPHPCVFLDGKRDNGEHIRRLFVGDLIWLFYFERLGIFRLMGLILDDYATKGTFPISTGFLPGAADDQTLMMLEAATLETKTGRSSTVRDRESAYRRGIGWTMRQIAVESQTNQALSEQLARLSFLTGQFFTDKRLAVAVRGAASPTANASVATLISIKDTIILLQNSFRQFYYGRTYTITLAGIVWAVAGMSLIRALRQTLGIAETLNRPEDYVTAAYDKFFGGAGTPPSRTNRYLVHRDCARAGRDLLLDIEMLDTTVPDFDSVGGVLDRWLSTVEAKFEAYRNSYRLLSGVDLALSEKPVIEQQA